MKFLIVKPSPLRIRIPFGSKYFLSILFSNNLSLRSSLNVIEHVSQPCSTTGILFVYFNSQNLIEKTKNNWGFISLSNKWK